MHAKQIAILGLMCGGILSGLAAQVPRPKTPAPDLQPPPLESLAEPVERLREGDDNSHKPPRDDELQKLLKARFNTAIRETAALWSMYEQGAVGMETLQSAATKRLYPAGSEALITAPERVAFTEQYVDFAKRIESYAKARYEAGRSSTDEMLQATYLRQDAEIQFLKAKRDTKVPAKR